MEDHGRAAAGVSPTTLVAVEIGLLLALPPFLFGALAAAVGGADAAVGGVLLGLAVGFAAAKLRREVYSHRHIEERAAAMENNGAGIETTGRTGLLVLLAGFGVLLSVFTLPPPVAGLLTGLLVLVSGAGFAVERRGS